MVPQQDVDPAVHLLRLALQAPDQVQERAVPVSPVGQVTYEHQVGVPSRPVQVLVHQFQAEENLLHLGEGAVSVAQGDDPRYAFKGPGGSPDRTAELLAGAGGQHCNKEQERRQYPACRELQCRPPSVQA